MCWITLLVFSIPPDAIHQAFFRVDQHRKTSEGIVVRLTCLRQSGEQCSLLRTSPDPYLQTRETEEGIGLYHLLNVGVPQWKRLDSNDMLDRIGQVVQCTRCLGAHESGQLWKVKIPPFCNCSIRGLVIIGIVVGPSLDGQRHGSSKRHEERTLIRRILLQCSLHCLCSPVKITLHRPSDGELHLIERTNDFLEADD